MRSKQKGFSAVEAIMILVIVALLAVVGWFVWQSKNKDDTSKTSNSSSETESTAKTSGKALEIDAIGVKVNDPDGRTLQMHAQKICAAECDTQDSYFIRDDNDAYFERCEYPAIISKLNEAADIKEVTDNPNGSLGQYTKKIGSDYFYVASGHFQAPCENLQAGDEEYETDIRQYIVDNMVKS